MPSVPNQETAHEALVRVCNEIDRSGTGTPDDYAFIRAILQDVVVDAMFQTHDKLREPVEPADHDANATVNRLLDMIHQDPSMNEPETRELFDLLADPDMQAVLMAHDDIARKSFEPIQYPLEPEPYIPPQSEPERPLDRGPDPGMERRPEEDDGPVRIVSVRRTPGEPLGITVGNEEGSPQLTVIRIAPGSTTDKQGLIHVGDIIAEVNGRSVSTPDELGTVIQTSGPDIKFKVIPAGIGSNGHIEKRYLKAHFSYNPHKDSRISAPALGLEFEPNDILEIVKDNDKNWWECRNLRTRKSGNIPSPSFEERRKQMVAPPPDKTKSSFLCGLGKKKKKPAKTITNPPPKQETPTVLYEEVVHVKPFRHRCLVLVGAQGIGRRSIKNRIIQMRPSEFGAPIPNTSRAQRDGEVDGRNYYFLDRAVMESDIKASKYLEYGELNKNYYGTSLSALKVVIDTNKTCIIDPKSAALPKLRTVEWMPYVVLIKPTDVDSMRQMNLQAINDGVDTQRKSDVEIQKILDETQRIQRQYTHLCDDSVSYAHFDSACSNILDMLEKANSTPQWVPSSWESATEKEPVMN